MFAKLAPYERIKPKVARDPTALEKRFHDYVARQGCLVCAAPATIHHVTASVHGGRLTRSHQRVAPLCPMHHQKVYDPRANDPVSVEGLGHKGFYHKHGIDLLSEAERLWGNFNGATEVF